MARQIVSELKFNLRDREYDLKLNSPIVAIEGKSGVGKSLMVKDLELEYVNPYGSKHNEVDVQVISWKNHRNGIYKLEKMVEFDGRSLFVIDDLDLLQHREGFDKNIFLQDEKNQYLLITRNARDYGVEPTDIATLTHKNKKVHDVDILGNERDYDGTLTEFRYRKA